MKILILILSFFTANSQDTAIWRVGNEASISQYNVQKSRDTGTWTTIATLAKGKKYYWYILPKETNYYRIKASGKDTVFSTRPILLTVSNNASTISNASVKTSATQDYLTWNVSKEINVDYYRIERSVGTAAYYLLTKTTARGYSKYGLYVSKVGTSRKYRIIAYFKDLSKTTTINFKQL